jgi:uncharacterized protein
MVSQTNEPAIKRQVILTTLKERLDTIRSFGVQSLALFGSVARDEATEASDLDFLVEFEGSATFDRYMDLKFFLEDLFGKPVDLVTRRSLKPQIAESVLEESISVT